MKIKYQVTLFDKSNKVRPVSTLVLDEEGLDLQNKEIRTALINKGVIQICQKRYWTKTDLKKYNLLAAKVRIYEEKK